MSAANETNPPAVTPSPADLEITRRSEIRRLCTMAKQSEAFTSNLIRSGVSIDQASREVLRVLAEESDSIRIDNHQPASVYGGEDSSEKYARGAVAGVMARAGLTGMIEMAKRNPATADEFSSFKVGETGGEFRAMSLMDLARESLERRGVRTRGLGREQLVSQAFTRTFGGASTSDFGILLENVMGKVLLGSYATVEDTWRRFAGTDSVTDFRESPRLRVGSFGSLDLVPEGSEYRSKPIPDGSKTSISTETRGNMIGITRNAIINDDLGAIASTVQRFGRSAGLSIEQAVYALLAQNGGLGPTMADGQPFFHSSRGNVGTGSALSVAGIDADRVVMMSQKDPSENEYLGLRPRTLVVPAGLGSEARIINGSKYDPTASTAFEKPNSVAGLYADVIDTPRLSGNRRYSFADPAAAPAIIVAFLNGQQAPFMETQNGWKTDGAEWKIRLDFKAQVFDPKGAVSNAGQ